LLPLKAGLALHRRSTNRHWRDLSRTTRFFLNDMLDSAKAFFTAYPALESILILAAVLLLAAATNLIAKHIVLKLISRGLAFTALRNERVGVERIVARLANIAPAFVIQVGIGVVPHIPLTVTTLIVNVSSAFIILTIALAIGETLSLINGVYQRRPDARNRPIKGYLQVFKIVIYVASAILIFAALIDRSPLILLSGLGAMAAVLMLVFKDTILSLVASVQITSNDMVRVGDWIEMPQCNADGDVIDIALHTVTVQNWDKTISTIPTQKLISESFKNWRGMSESGTRRIMRSLMIDQTTIRFLKDEEIEKLRKFSLLSGYLDKKRAELRQWNEERPECKDYAGNARRLTNIGTFRAYVLAYLQAREDISDTATMLVRQLAPTQSGLPLEIFCFTTTTVWAEYERIQADIFDHLLSILPEFDLLLYQQPTGRDMRALAGASQGSPIDTA